MSRNQRIIDLHAEGFEAASIAAQLGIWQNMAEDVLREAGLIGASVVRLRERLVEALAEAGSVEIYTVSPPDSIWSGLPVNTAAGLEAALLRRFELPWNRKT